MASGIRIGLLAGATGAALLAGGSMPAEAGGFAVREQGAYGQGASFAGVSAGGASPSTMFWNPATITQHPGVTVEKGFSILRPDGEVRVDRATSPFVGFVPAPGPGLVPLPPVGLGGVASNDHGQTALVPSGYGVVQVGDDVFLGIGVGAPYGLVTSADPKSWSGRFHGITSDLKTVNVNPTAAWRINEVVSVGIGLQVQYIEVRLNNAQLAFVPGFGFAEGIGEVEGDDIGLGFTAGVTISPGPDTTIGLGFRSAVEHSLEGSSRLTIGPSVQNLGAVTAGSTLPEQVTLGIRHRLDENWTLLGQAEWTNWSRFDELRISFADPRLPDNVTDQSWDDGWFFSLGAEYAWSDMLTLRAGAAYEISPVPDSTRTPRIPDADRIWVSAGASIKATERLSLDLAYSHIFVDEAPMNLTVAGDPLNATRGEFAGSSKGGVDIFSAALRFSFGGKPSYAPPAEAVPVVSKGW